MLKIVSVPVASWITAAPVTALMVTEKLLAGPGLVQGRIGTGIVNWVAPAGIEA
jgi:hypothetical protein